MGLFQEREGDTAIIVENGVYRQVPVYTRDGYLYAKAAGGFIRLNVDGSTTKPKCRLDHLDITAEILTDRLGRLCFDGVQGARHLEASKKQLLLGATD